MKTRVTCPKCQQTDLYEKILGGTQIECSGCKSKLAIREASPVADRPVAQVAQLTQREKAPAQASLISDSQSKIECPCPGCGVRLRMPASCAGKMAKCPRCNSHWKIEPQGLHQTESYSLPLASRDPLPDVQTQSHAARQADWWSEIEQANLATFKPQESWQTQDQASFSITSSANNGGPIKVGFWNSIGAWFKHRRTKFRWKEPMNFRARLRNDLYLRLGIGLSFGIFFVGTFYGLFTFNISTPPMIWGVPILFLMGITVALTLLMVGKNTASGSAYVSDRAFERWRLYSWFIIGWIESYDWPFKRLSKCYLVPAAALRKSFSVLLLPAEDGFEIIGIPNKIDIQQVIQHIQSRGVAVEATSSIPKKFTKPLNMGVAVTAMVVFLFVGLSGLTTFLVLHDQTVPEPIERNRLRERTPASPPDFRNQFPSGSFPGAPPEINKGIPPDFKKQMERLGPPSQFGPTPWPPNMPNRR